LFEVMCASVIAADSAMTVYTVDAQVANLQAVEDPAIAILGRIFLAFYWLELVIKMSVHRAYFFVNENAAWNWFDLALVAFALVDEFMAAAMGGGGADVTFMRSMRIFRMAKILRGLRLMRFFGELRIMLNSIMGSVFALFWSLVMMTVIFYLFGLMLVLGSVEYLMFSDGPEVTEEMRTMVTQAYGGVSVAMMSLFKAAMGGDDWGYYYEIAAMVGSFEAFVFIVFIAFTFVAVLNILTGIFVENAMKCAKPDTAAVAHEHRKQLQADSAALRRLYRELTGTTEGRGDQLLTLKLFSAALHRNAHVRAQMSLLGLEVRDGATFFNLLTSMCGRREVDMDSFVDSCLRLKGAPSSIDVHSIKFQTQAIKRSIKDMSAQLVASQCTFEDEIGCDSPPCGEAEPEKGVHGADSMPDKFVTL